MYKKITHNIVEEHFGHPELASRVLKASWPPLGTRYAYASAVRTQLRNFNQDLRDAIISTLTNSPNDAFNHQQLKDTISNFSTIFQLYYGPSDVESIKTYFSNYAKTILEMAAAARDGKDTNVARAVIQQQLIDLTNFLNDLNPQWRVSFTVPMLTYLERYTQTLYDQITSRKSGDWAADDTASKLAEDILCGGPMYMAPFSGTQDFANCLANGVIQQYPDKFN